MGSASVTRGSAGAGTGTLGFDAVFIDAHPDNKSKIAMAKPRALAQFIEPSSAEQVTRRPTARQRGDVLPARYRSLRLCLCAIARTRARWTSRDPCRECGL